MIRRRESSMAKGDNLEERLVDFAVMVIHLNEDLSGIYQECDELCRIVNASIKTSKKRKIQRK